MVPCLNVVHGKNDGRQADLENEQISATWTPKMEPESSKSLQRMSKKGIMSQQWRHLGNRRHLRRQKKLQRGPTEGPMEPQMPVGDEQQASMGRTGSKKVSKKGPNERPWKS